MVWPLFHYLHADVLLGTRFQLRDPGGSRWEKKGVQTCDCSLRKLAWSVAHPLKVLTSSTLFSGDLDIIISLQLLTPAASASQLGGLHWKLCTWTLLFLSHRHKRALIGTIGSAFTESKREAQSPRQHSGRWHSSGLCPKTGTPGPGFSPLSSNAFTFGPRLRYFSKKQKRFVFPL